MKSLIFNVMIFIVFNMNVVFAENLALEQEAHGDKNVQIIGNSNYVDNRTYVFNIGIDSKLMYSFSNIEESEGGKYLRRLNIQAKGNIPIYNPEIYLRFDKPVQEADFKFLGGMSPLFNLKTNSDQSTKKLNNIEYFFATKEFTPGVSIQFLFYNNTKFDVSEFKINGQKIF